MDQSRTNKVAKVTALFWATKIVATTLGETAADLLSKTILGGVQLPGLAAAPVEGGEEAAEHAVTAGYVIGTGVFLTLLAVALVVQIAARRFHPVVYWTVILLTSTAGTTTADMMSRTFGLGYGWTAAVLVTFLAGVLLAWWFTQRSLSVNRIVGVKAELFYWAAILVSNTLGTALGDWLGDESGPHMQLVWSTTIISAALLAAAALHYTTRVSGVLLFWWAFVLTRPFGATFGDLLMHDPAKEGQDPAEGGLGLGPVWSSLILAVLFAGLIALTMWWDRRADRPGVRPDGDRLPPPPA